MECKFRTLINNCVVIHVIFRLRVHVSQMFKNSHDKSFKPSDVVSVGDNVRIPCG